MNIQEAYNKGLSDAEQPIIETFKDLLTGGKGNPLSNPELEKIRKALIIQLKWLHNIAAKKASNVGKYAKIEIDKSIEILTKV